MTLTEFIPLAPRSKNVMYFATTSVSAGEPAEICTELEQCDLGEYITGGRTGFYMIRANGDSMEYEIRSGDWLITDRNSAPQSGDIIVASINGDYVVKDYKASENGILLIPKNEKYKPRIIKENDEFETFGVVVGIVRHFKKI